MHDINQRKTPREPSDDDFHAARQAHHREQGPGVQPLPRILMPQRVFTDSSTFVFLQPKRHASWPDHAAVNGTSFRRLEI